MATSYGFIKGLYAISSKMCTPPLDFIPFDDLPPFCQNIQNILKRHGMDKASVDLYVQNYFARLLKNFESSFSIPVVLKGWELSGMYPYSCHQMLLMCPSIQGLHLTDSNLDLLVVRLQSLSVDVEISGESSDEKLESVTNDLEFLSSLTASTTDITNLATNRKRCLWLNQGGVIAHRRERRDAAAQLVVAKLAKQNQQLAKQATQANLEAAAPTDPLPGPPPKTVICNSCSIIFSIDFATAVKGDQWKGCLGCKGWYCYKKPCSDSAKFYKHISICSALHDTDP